MVSDIKKEEWVGHGWLKEESYIQMELCNSPTEKIPL